MGKIKQLPLHEAHKIAAGEVVERPANIVKELLENSIDAGATQITLHIQDGGKKLIRVTDNGCGMSADDARICFNKHATSKISQLKDLENINTFGFRGEALASVAAVGKVTLITKDEDSPEGIKLHVSQSAIQDEEMVPTKTGTDIAIQDLFYAIPARKKFLKKRETEWRHIQQLFHAFCFTYPNIHFKLFSEDKLLINCPATSDILSRVSQVWDHTTAKHMIEISHEKHGNALTVSGVISNHHKYKYDRSGMYFFVNNRWVKNHYLSKAVLKGYQHALREGHFPIGLFHIKVDPQQVDINIHPRKEEVKFLHPRAIEHALQEAVRFALEKYTSSHISPAVKHTQPQSNKVSAPKPNLKEPYVPYNFETLLQEQASARSPIHTFTKYVSQAPQERKIDIQPPSSGHIASTANKQTSSAVSFTMPNQMENEKIQNQTQEPIPQLEQTQSFSILGQYNKTYILIEQEEGLFFVDQHAAHERILYQEFNTRFENIPTIQLMFPQIINLSAQDLELLEKHIPLLAKNGIELEVFGSNQVSISATPVHLKSVNLEELVHQVIAWAKELEHVDDKDLFKQLNEKLHAQMACKAAVKAGDTLTMEKMHQLLVDLYKTENRFSCPHGRPTGWLLTLHDIEKKFRRKL